ncbi:MULTISPECIES: hypothetical protein [unclassified Francisella]|uniref:hypothetical protein n=1 Tax=unclassified Francisella TaxID=2610885 RepID=UPI002E32AE74|nr:MULTISPECIES: hypothetical protein [unclassified Francisella]MED7818914.1 hypothetical protein [Francisella sp. 19S2-4]MED7829751.1 hypothetical protein [Francisella sp. 19S2-10]
MNLLELQKALGYKVSEGGMCYGIAYMAIQAIIRNQLGTYIERINLLDSLIKFQGGNEKEAIDKLVNDIKQAELKRADKQTRQILAPHENKLLDILAWLDGVQIYHGLDFKSIGKSKYYVNYQDYQRSTNFFGSNDEGYQKIFLQSKDVCLLTRKKIYEIYNKITNSNKSIAFSITRPGHIIAIGKSKSHNDIYLINHNHHSIINSVDQAFNLVYRSCFEGVISEDKAISILEFSDTPSTNINSYFNFDTLSLTDKNKQDLLYIALREGHTQAVQNYTKYILENQKYKLLNTNNKDDFPGLYVAMQNGHIETVKAYIEIIAQSHINSQDKQKLLLAEGCGISGLCIAMQNGHVETVEAYIEIIAQSHINAQDKQKLLLAERCGFSGLYIVMQNGHAEMIKAYIETIININSCFGIDKYELISACTDISCTPGLYSILEENGHAKSIEAYIEAIDSINDASINKFKQQILSAEDTTNSTPGLFMALAKGHTDAVEAYIKAVINLKDRCINKQDLLAAKDNSTPGLYIALENGHAKVIKAYIETIASTNCQSINKYELIEAKSEEVSGLYMALDNGHAEAVKSYIQTVSKINTFNYEEKAKLFAAKSNYGTPGLQNPINAIIKYESKIEAISNYLKEVKGNDISTECANIIMNDYTRAKQMKYMLLKWASEYQPSVSKNRNDYPLLIKLLSYNRSSRFKREVTTSMKEFMSYKNWY